MADPAETTRVSQAPADVETRELLDAVRSLSVQVGSLQSELQALRSEAGVLPAAQESAHGWDERPVGRPEAPAWVRSLDTPASRRPPVPRLALEILFLAAVAVVAALAGFEPVVVVVLMALAWALVATMEWLASAEDSKRETALLRSGLASSTVRDDAAWFAPPVPPRAAGVSGAETAARLPPPAAD